MLVYAENKLEFIVSVLSLAFSVGTLMCLAIVFAGCTSTSSPSYLYFMKARALDFSRSWGAIRFDISDLLGTVTSEATEVGKNVADSVTQSSATVQMALPVYDAIVLWGYCQGEKDDAPYSDCSKPKISFSFDLVDIFRLVSREMDNVLPSEVNNIFSGLPILAKWLVSTYMIGFVPTASAFALGSMTIFCSLEDN
ncbi:hypothetical protein POX_c04577 [Penicillium oxalicum]|uniref:hypothetical protein n=1 Tax=Penicillium oxalicum TaxID=69781 RepID=UPI0020B7D96C|nr:hypothetical protein POX_c04577 [Penicillium oxalicum]KAI2791705.1 hypothetical protein POX_c04577 [Penicillium oxalicum]